MSVITPAATGADTAQKNTGVSVSVLTIACVGGVAIVNTISYVPSVIFVTIVVSAVESPAAHLYSICESSYPCAFNSSIIPSLISVKAPFSIIETTPTFTFPSPLVSFESVFPELLLPFPPHPVNAVATIPTVNKTLKTFFIFLIFFLLFFTLSFLTIWITSRVFIA